MEGKERWEEMTLTKKKKKMAFGHCEEHSGIFVRPLAWPSAHGAMARGPEQPITWLSTASLISRDRNWGRHHTAESITPRR